MDASEEEYTQLDSWEDLIAWLESLGMKSTLDIPWNPAPKRKSKKKPPQEEGLF